MIDNKTIREVVISDKLFPGGGGEPTYDTRTASGAVANFETNNTLDIVSGIFSIPYDENGYSSLNVTRAGKNLFDISGGQILNAYFGATLTEYSVTRTLYVKCSPNTTYTVSKTAGQRFAFGYTKELPAIGVSVFGGVADNTASSITITTGADAKYLVAYVFNGNSDSGTADEMLASVQLEQGSTATTYEAYQGTTYPISWAAVDVYGGDLNITAGKLISKYDSEGQLLPEPVEISITPVAIPTLEGINNIYADIGKVDVIYKYQTGTEPTSKVNKWLPIFYPIRKGDT